MVVDDKEERLAPVTLTHRPSSTNVEALTTTNRRVSNDIPPIWSHPSRSTKRMRERDVKPWELLVAGYHWGLWLLLVVLMVAQLGCAVWDHSTTSQHVVEGQSIALGAHDIVEDVDDEPYADRVLACVLQNRQYKPVLLSNALSGTSVKVGVDSDAKHGYRIVRRSPEVGMVDDLFTRYGTACDLLASTLDTVVDSCTALGYNVTTDLLRVVDGVASGATLWEVTDSLPVLIQPLADNNPTARYVIPSYDGSACVVRLTGKYEAVTAEKALLRGISRQLREQKTIEFLAAAVGAGTWRHGWYEDNDRGMKWHSDLVSTNPENTDGVSRREFDTLENVERDCVSTDGVTACADLPVEQSWGQALRVTNTQLWFDSISISNGTRYGIFQYESSDVRVVTSTYDLETFLTNALLLSVLVRWFICMVAAQNGHVQATTNWHCIDLGVLGCQRHLHLVSVVLLPRLKPMLAVLWTVGCVFDGEQRAMADAWFVVYPSLAALVMQYYSLLNLVAKMLRCRPSPMAFGPTLIFLCGLHLLRHKFALHGWFGHGISRIGQSGSSITASSLVLPAMMHSSEYEELALRNMFEPSIVLSISGGVRWLINLKLVVLALNVLPLLVGSQRTSQLNKRWAPHGVCRSEVSFALRVCLLGGYGRSSAYMITDKSVSEAKPKDVDAPRTTEKLPRAALTGYELLRTGYVVLGEQLVLSIDHWMLLVVLSCFRKRAQAPNYRVVVFAIVYDADRNRRWVSTHPELCRINDPRLQKLHILDITTWPMH